MKINIIKLKESREESLMRIFNRPEKKYENHFLLLPLTFFFVTHDLSQLEMNSSYNFIFHLEHNFYMFLMDLRITEYQLIFQKSKNFLRLGLVVSCIGL